MQSDVGSLVDNEHLETAAREELSPPERIYDAALRCFLTLGVRRTTMDKIASEAGLSRPTIYYYFADKNAVIQEVLLRRQAQGHRAHKAILFERKLDGLDAISEATVLGIERALADPYSLEFTGPDAERITAQILQSPAAVEIRNAFWGPLVQAAREAGEISPHLSDDEIIAWILFFQFSLVRNGALFGLSGRDSIAAAVRRLLLPAFSLHPHS